MKNLTVKTMQAIALGIIVSMASTARADQKISLLYGMPVHVKCNINEGGCYNNPGPQITLDGEISLGGLAVDLIFKNNLKGTHTDVVTFSNNLVLVPLGTKIVIPKQPVLGGVGGNPHIWLQFMDSKGNYLSDEIYLGRCVQGLTLENDFVNETFASTLISASGCYNNPGPVITFGGELSLSGLKARLIFRNNVKGTHTAEAFTDVTLIGDKTPVVIPKQPSLGGAGGNPLVFINFSQCDGEEIGNEIFLGRCNKL